MATAMIDYAQGRALINQSLQQAVPAEAIRQFTGACLLGGGVTHKYALNRLNALTGIIDYHGVVQFIITCPPALINGFISALVARDSIADIPWITTEVIYNAIRRGNTVDTSTNLLRNITIPQIQYEVFLAAALQADWSLPILVPLMQAYLGRDNANGRDEDYRDFLTTEYNLMIDGYTEYLATGVLPIPVDPTAYGTHAIVNIDTAIQNLIL